MSLHEPFLKPGLASNVNPSITKSQNDFVDNSTTRPPPRFTIVQRLSRLGCCILVLGTAGLLVLLGVLYSLWRESMKAITGTSTNQLWVHTIQSGWTTRTVTICTAVIRMLMAAQSGIFTACAAALLMETVGVPLSQGPLYSIMRAISPAPHHLLTSLNRKHKSGFAILLHSLVVVEVILVLASQFISTILLTDFTYSSVSATSNQSTVRIIQDTADSSRLPWQVHSTAWTSQPYTAQRFAEISEDFTQGSNFHDTGHTYRAFIPFESENQRTRLRSYSGPATVMDLRVMCVPPQVNNASILLTDPASNYFRGSVGIDEGFEQLRNTPTLAPVNVTCDLGIYPSGQSPNTTVSQLSFCTVWSDTGSVLLENPIVEPNTKPIRPANPDDLTEFDVSVPRGSSTFYVLDLRRTREELSRGGFRNSNSWQPLKFASKSSAWVHLENQSGVEAVRLTACYVNLGFNQFKVNFTSPNDGPEPPLLWDHKSSSYDTEAIRSQLGGSLHRDTTEDRGLLGLSPRSTWEQFGSFGDRSAARWTLEYLSIRLGLPKPTTPAIHSDVELDNGAILSTENINEAGTAHQSHAMLFQDTLRATESPALALQAVLSRIQSMIYYEHFIKLDGTAPAATVFSTDILLPQQWIGLIGGSVIILLHLLTVGITTVLFLIFSQYSILGNYWQAAAQAVPVDALPMVPAAGHLKDSDVKRHLGEHLSGSEATVHLQLADNGHLVLDCRERSSRTQSDL